MCCLQDDNELSQGHVQWQHNCEYRAKVQCIWIRPVLADYHVTYIGSDLHYHVTYIGCDMHYHVT